MNQDQIKQIVEAADSKWVEPKMTEDSVKYEFEFVPAKQEICGECGKPSRTFEFRQVGTRLGGIPRCADCARKFAASAKVPIVHKAFEESVQAMIEADTLFEKGLPPKEYWAQQGKTPWGADTQAKKKPSSGSEFSKLTPDQQQKVTAKLKSFGKTEASLSATDDAIINGIVMMNHADAELITRYGGKRPGKVLQFKSASPETIQAVALAIAKRFHGQIKVVANASAGEIRLLTEAGVKEWVTTKEIRGFASGDQLSGARKQTVLPVGTRVRSVGTDMYDPIAGEPVTWMDAFIDGSWKQVGSIELPVLKSGWKKDYFKIKEASAQKMLDATAFRAKVQQNIQLLSGILPTSAKWHIDRNDIQQRYDGKGSVEVESLEEAQEIFTKFQKAMQAAGWEPRQHIRTGKQWSVRFVKDRGTQEIELEYFATDYRYSGGRTINAYVRVWAAANTELEASGDGEKVRKRKYYSGYQIGAADKVRGIKSPQGPNDNQDWWRGYSDAWSGKSCEVKSPLEFLGEAQYQSGDNVVARGEEWHVIDRSDDEAEQMWAVARANPDRDAILSYKEITKKLPRTAGPRAPEVKENEWDVMRRECNDIIRREGLDATRRNAR